MVSFGIKKNKKTKFDFLNDRHGSLVVVNWTCDPVLALGQTGSNPTPGVSSAAIPLGKGLPVHYLVFSDGT